MELSFRVVHGSAGELGELLIALTTQPSVDARGSAAAFFVRRYKPVGGIWQLAWAVARFE
jgi:hypothetical protein